MRVHKRKIINLFAGAALALTFGAATRADDTEIFMIQPANTVQPNIMLILDTSGSMNYRAESTLLPYDPTFSYSNAGTGEGRNNDNSCQNDRIYYSTSSTAPMSCVGLSYIQLSGNFSASTPQQLKCRRAVDALAWGTGRTGVGFYSDRFIRWRGQGNSRTWQSSLANANGSTTSGSTSNGSSYATDVECLEDAKAFADGGHGVDAASSATYPQIGMANQQNGRWTSTATSSWWGAAGNTGVAVTLYSPNYIRYLRNGPRDNLTRMDVVKAAAASFLQGLPNVNVGLMRYSSNAQGGMVMSPVSSLNPKRAAMIADITTSNRYEPSGNTPLSETLFEAYRYFSGGEVLYGAPHTETGTYASRMCTLITNPNSGDAGNCASNSTSYFESVLESRNGNTYISPATESCQANYIVYLTDGEATSDNDADALITGLPRFGSTPAVGDDDQLGGVGCVGTGAGRCLGGLTEYMYRADLRDTVAGQQNVRTYFIGFGPDFSGDAAAFQKLQNAATRGGGQAYQADDLSSLAAVFNSIVTNILQTSTTFTTPTVAVNAFNRTQTLDDLFVSVFQPNTGAHWPGNLKKYRVDDGRIEDSAGNPAVDPQTGFFAEASRSFWSSASDGAAVAAGGAASQIPDPASRNLYTYIGQTHPSGGAALSSYEVSTSNTTLDAATHFQLGAAGDPTLANLINWARGQDVLNEDGDAGTTVRHVMGDPLHSPPSVVIYGGDEDDPDAVVYIITNDGYLHAVDADSGEELWAYIPQEYLPYLKELYFNNPRPTKRYALDGEITVLKYDVDGDGTVESGDRVILFFGTGRGGSRYYAIDVTEKENPRYLWSIGPSDLPGVGQTWSTPTIARVSVGGATQNSQKLVLVLGGGYDPVQDTSDYVVDSVGNRLYIVDALRGTLLWSAGPSGANLANLNLARMTHSIPSSVAVLDTNSDGYADRMYVGDMAAQLWRFDITNGNEANSLVAGGVIASLGVKAANGTVPATIDPANTRRFYSRPDVSALQQQGSPPFLNIAIGSGYRGRPLNDSAQDRFYSIRDLQPLARLTQAQYDALTVLVDDDLTDITTDVAAVLPPNARGWKLLLNRPEWRGEKSLGPSNTFNNSIFFTTYTPATSTSENLTACTRSSTGTNRAYVVNAFNGAPVPRRDSQTDPGGGGDGGNGGGSGGEGGEGGEDGLDADDRYDDLAQGGIAPEISFLFPEKDKVVCLSGVEVLDVCTNFNSRIKTYWRESSAP